MSQIYCDVFGVQGSPTTDESMREYCKRPGKVGLDGKPLYYTEQNHKKECDVNQIIKRYDKTGLISHVSKMEARFGDMTGISFQSMQNKVANANSMFEKMPIEIKKFFKGKVENLLTFMEDPNNREKAIELGLIDKRWTPQSDGLGEHVLEGQNVIDPDLVDKQKKSDS